MDTFLQISTLLEIDYRSQTEVKHSYLIRSISDEFQPQFGSGFSVRQLERYRQFYRMFPIASTLRSLRQLQMYVNYYDRYEKQDFENPTIGILF